MCFRNLSAYICECKIVYYLSYQKYYCGDIINYIQVIIRSEDQRQIVLTTLARNLWSWRIKVTKVKAIYYILNMLHTEGQNFVGECWLPTADMGQVQMILNKASVSYVVNC